MPLSRSRLQSVFCLALLVTVAAGCGSSGDDGGHHDAPKNTWGPQPNVAIAAVGNRLSFEADVPGEQSAAVSESVSSLYALPLSSSDYSVNNMARIMGLSSTSPSDMQAWMENRVQFITPQGFDFESHLSLSATPFTYPEAGVLPDAVANSAVEAQPLKRVASQDSSVVMLNIGAAVYVAGKKMNQLLQLDLPGVGSVAMTSPRVGLLEVGPGLFPDLGGRQVQNVLLDIYRAGTLFHEARHSDGHGKTMGFMHSLCPAGHDYEGQYACDASINGPYTIGAMVHKNLMNACTGCTVESRRALQSIYLDIASRVLNTADAPANLSREAAAGTNWDATPEGSR